LLRRICGVDRRSIAGTGVTCGADGFALSDLAASDLTASDWAAADNAACWASTAARAMPASAHRRCDRGDGQQRYFTKEIRFAKRAVKTRKRHKRWILNSAGPD
jgi:hypothetical protein